MVDYPRLSRKQQQGLPQLLQLTELVQMFEDSTHRLWRCTTTDGEMLLKICDENNVKNSSFWQGMSLLFAVDLPQQLDEFSQNYDFIREISYLVIPDYIASSSVEQTTKSPAFILAKMEAGTMVDESMVDAAMVKALAKQLSQLHQRQTIQWGCLLQSSFSAQQWAPRLHFTLEKLAENGNIPDDILIDALKQAKSILPKHFVPIMLDLRWDQFLQKEGRLSALVDLDAFAIGPRELELVLLECLLDQQHIDVFQYYYQQNHKIPDLSSVRMAYRLLLFLMNILGENDVDAWMHAPTRFK